MSRKKREPFNGKKWPVAVAVAAMAVLAFWKWCWNVTVLDYGAPDKTYFDVKEASPGQEVHIRFDDTTWVRICRSRLVQQVTCQQDDPFNPNKTITARLDLDAHPISAPEHAGKLAPKARRFVVPRECRPGPLRFVSWAESECPPFGNWNLRYAYPPELTLQVK